MTPKHYFYTDPLAAAWMAKHFGMKIYCPVWKGDGIREKSNQPLPLWVFGRIIEATSRQGLGVERFTVAEESLGILQPISGDVVIGSWVKNSAAGAAPLRRIWGVVRNTDIQDKMAYLYSDSYSSFEEDAEFDFDYIRIIQRDGKPFFWPESEEI